MPYRDRIPIRLSLGEVAAAGVCCGLVALSAFLVEAIDPRDDAPVAVYAGVHIPGGRDGSVRGVRAEEASDDAAEDGSQEEGRVCSKHEVAMYSKPQTSSASWSGQLTC